MRWLIDLKVQLSCSAEMSLVLYLRYSVDGLNQYISISHCVTPECDKRFCLVHTYIIRTTFVYIHIVNNIMFSCYVGKGCAVLQAIIQIS